MVAHEYKNVETDHPLVEQERDAWKARALALTIYADELRDRIRDAYLEAFNHPEDINGTDIQTAEMFCREHHETKVRLTPGATWPVEKV